MATASQVTPADHTAPWFAVSADDAVKRLDSDGANGLRAAEASRRLAQYGPNRLPEGKRTGPFQRFLSQFNNILV